MGNNEIGAKRRDERRGRGGKPSERNAEEGGKEGWIFVMGSCDWKDWCWVLRIAAAAAEKVVCRRITGRWSVAESACGNAERRRYFTGECQCAAVDESHGRAFPPGYTPKRSGLELVTRYLRKYEGGEAIYLLNWPFGVSS